LFLFVHDMFFSRSYQQVIHRKPGSWLIATVIPANAGIQAWLGKQVREQPRYSGGRA